MNAFESFMNNRPSGPKPDAIETGMPQPGSEFEKNQADVENAKQEFEGIVLYAPIANDLKQELLSALGEVSLTDPYDSDYLQYKRVHLENGDPQRAALWVRNKIEPAVQKVVAKLTPQDKQKFESALAGLWIDRPDYNKQVAREWMDAGPSKEA